MLETLCTGWHIVMHSVNKGKVNGATSRRGIGVGSHLPVVGR